jgi:hypothetical protein
MLDWSKASHYSFLEEFELLWDTHQDIRSKPWADPVIRATMKQAQHIQCVKEDIYNCNIEIHHLHTHVLNKNANLKRIICKLGEQGHLIAGAVNEYVVRRI